MADTYVLLQKINVGSAGVSSVTFSNIPQTGYTDLIVKCSFRSSADNVTAELSLNGVKTNMTQRHLQGTGTAASSGSSSAINVLENPSSATASTFASADIYITNYASSNYKLINIDTVTEKYATDAYSRLTAGLWSNTAAITSIGLNCSASGNFVQHSTFSLYGVSKSDVSPTLSPKANGGNIIQTDGTYWYHAFRTSGSFTPITAISADVLVVAGGGGSSSSGGGAGGLQAFTSQSLTATPYVVTIGSGGALGTATVTDAVNGSGSQFGALTVSVGGGGGKRASGTLTGATGGSGSGGTSLNTTSLGAGGAGTSGQGNAGGSGQASNGAGNAGGGGGGAGAAGGNSVYLSSGGAGGVGSSTYSSWGLVTGTGQNSSGTVYFAGGGGGQGYTASYLGAGGLGGGATANATAGHGTANTGGGAGACYQPGNAAGNGGSGIIIVRYAV